MSQDALPTRIETDYLLSALAQRAPAEVGVRVAERCLFCNGELDMYYLPDSTNRHVCCPACGASGPWGDTDVEAKALYARAPRDMGQPSITLRARQAAEDIQRMYRSTNEALGYEHYEPSIEAVEQTITTHLSASRGDGELISKPQVVRAIQDFVNLFQQPSSPTKIAAQEILSLIADLPASQSAGEGGQMRAAIEAVKAVRVNSNQGTAAEVRRANYFNEGVTAAITALETTERGGES